MGIVDTNRAGKTQLNLNNAKSGLGAEPEGPGIWLRTGGVWSRVIRVKSYANSDWESIPVKNRKNGAWKDES